MTDGEHVDASRWTKYKVEERWDLNTRLDFSHKIQPKKKKVNLKGPKHCVCVCVCVRARISTHVLSERYQVLRGRRSQSN